MLTKENIEQYHDLQKAFEKVKGVIYEDIDRIVKAICKACGTEIDYYYGDEDTDAVFLELTGDVDDMYVSGQFIGKKNLFDPYRDSFPGCFFFMTDEEIIKHIHDEIKAEKDARAKKASKHKQYLKKRKVIDKKLKEYEKKLKSKLSVK